MEYTYKPKIEAIQYTGSIDKVIEFMGRKNITHIESNIFEDISDDSIYISTYSISQMSVGHNEYILKTTFEDGEICYEKMDPISFKRMYKKIERSDAFYNFKYTKKAVEGIKQGLGIQPISPSEDKPERSGRVGYSENYCYIDPLGEIRVTSDMNTEHDRKCWEAGNYFRTEKEAKQARDQWLLLLKYKQWRKLHDPVALDWGRNADKYYIYYDHNKKAFRFYLNTHSQHMGAMYFSSYKLAEQFYNEHKDLIHKVLSDGVVLGVG